ncbi:small ribosomal subunit protein uS3x-like isoform X4 [Alnus glutinosa]|uniref:small ribosomal subunit protein uS3x-like isoform X4 n=1 Tax=Alnus glutinosa TaxID=3517 RepID=UPI002D78CC13|nr:small ribosomal subunit protein uS3x-like isoform X4 [Alnus glutinosa]
MATQMSKKRKFVADGVFYAELNEVLTRELAEDGYSGVEVRVRPMRTEITIRATRTQNILGLAMGFLDLSWRMEQKDVRACYGVRFIMEDGAKGCEGLLWCS